MTTLYIWWMKEYCLKWSMSTFKSDKKKSSWLHFHFIFLSRRRSYRQKNSKKKGDLRQWARLSGFGINSPKCLLYISFNIRFEKLGLHQDNMVWLCALFPEEQPLPAATLRRFKSSGESFELGLDTILSRLVVEPFSDSTVMVIPEVPDAPSAVVGHTHLAWQKRYFNYRLQAAPLPAVSGRIKAWLEWATESRLLS